jgi:hypothetical protein
MAITYPGMELAPANMVISISAVMKMNTGMGDAFSKSIF